MDLTLESLQELEANFPILPPFHPHKKAHKNQRRSNGSGNQQASTKKFVQWKDTKGPALTPNRHTTEPILKQSSYTLDKYNQPVPFFPPPPPPFLATFGQQRQNPFHSQQRFNGTFPLQTHPQPLNPDQYNAQTLISNPFNHWTPAPGNVQYPNPFSAHPSNQKL